MKYISGFTVNWNKPPDAYPGMPSVETLTPRPVGENGAMLYGNLVYTGDPEATAYGFVVSTNGIPTTDNDVRIQTIDVAKGEFTHELTELSGGTTFYIRAYATNSNGTVYGKLESITTTSDGIIIISTDAVTSISYTSVTLNGIITQVEGATVHGFVYSTEQEPTTSDNNIDLGQPSAGSFTYDLTGITADTQYHVRAYAINADGTTYGEDITFSTLAYSLPAITTQDVSDVTQETATFNGNVTNLGVPNATAHGFVYSTSENPTVGSYPGGGITDEGTPTTGAFTSSATGLTGGTTYYVRAYITNAGGTAYGAQKTMTTSAYVEPVVTTQAATSVTDTTATFNGNITTLGEPEPTAHGFVYNTTGTPVKGVDTTVDLGAASATGAFTADITELLDNTTYYIRSFVTGGGTTVYGSQQTMLTLPAADPPVTADASLFLYATEGITLNGSRVSGWADQSGNNNDFSQATAGLQPLKTTLGGVDAVRFDGITDNRYMAISPGLSYTRCTVYMAFRLETDYTEVAPPSSENYRWLLGVNDYQFPHLYRFSDNLYYGSGADVSFTINTGQWNVGGMVLGSTGENVFTFDKFGAIAGDTASSGISSRSFSTIMHENDGETADVGFNRILVYEGVHDLATRQSICENLRAQVGL